MKVEETKYSIAEVVDWYRQRQLVVNEQYQRAGGLWPNSAKSYFIDTILRGFPFPKVYFFERLDRETKKPKREIVDGQQRIGTIVSFLDNKFELGRNAGEWAGLQFKDLPEETQDSFYSYTIAVDVIRNADRSDILQMFRRMNAYTLPLSEAEKRHSEFFGEFKDWITITLDKYGSMLTNWEILTSRQSVRMRDAELIADIALAMEEGIVSTSPTKLRSLYKGYDSDFPERDRMNEQLSGAFDVLLEELSGLQQTYMTKTHVFHSLVCALIHCKFGLPGAEKEIGLETLGVYFKDRDSAMASLKQLAAAHEAKDEGRFSAYAKAASEGGNRVAQRAVRVRYICQALRGELP